MRFLILFLLLPFCSCAYVRRSNERFYLNVTKYELNQLPKSIKDFCDLHTNIGPQEIVPGDKSYYINNVIHYNLSNKSSIIHEASHYYLRDKDAYCLREIIAYYLEDRYQLKRRLHFAEVR